MIEWISVDDRLPRVYETVLIGWNDAETDFEFDFLELNADDISDDVWASNSETIPTHWMPIPKLPEPPK